MRKLLFLLFISFAPFAAAQSFEKKDHVIQLNNGFQIINFTTEAADTNYTANQDAGSRHSAFQYEWAAARWLGVGFFANSVNYYAVADTDNIRPTAKSNDFGLLLNGHFAPGPKFDFSGQLLLGTSDFNLRNNKSGDAANTLKGRGLITSFRLQGRYYVNHWPLAIGLYYGLTRYEYGTVIDRKNNEFNLKGLGPDLGISLSLRLRPKKK